MQPKVSSNPRSTSTGMAAPPETHSRSDETSGRSPVWCSMAAYIVGTPSKIVTRSRWMISRALPGSNLGSSVSVPPAVTVAFSPQVRPNTWNSGRQPMTTSTGAALQQGGRGQLGVAGQVRVGQLGALGPAGGARRVEDHGIVVVAAVRGDRRGILVSEREQSGRRPSTTLAPVSAAPLAASPAAPCQANSTFAPESPR